MLLLLVYSVLFYGAYSENVAVTDDTIIDVVPNFPTSEAGNRKYYFGTIYKGNYLQAVEFCNYHEMSLLSIESSEEDRVVFNKLQKFLEDGKYTFWTSGTRVPEDHWVWLSTGRPVAYAPTTFTHPANKTKGCLEVQYFKSKGKLVWNDADCGLARHAICETALSKSIVNLERACASCNLTLIN